MSASYTHEHFDPPRPGETPERPWTTEAVDFIAELLRGEVEIRTTFRGSTPVAIDHFNLDDSGEPRLLEHTGLLVSARLFVWRAKRTATERVSFQ